MLERNIYTWEKQIPVEVADSILSGDVYKFVFSYLDEEYEELRLYDHLRFICNEPHTIADREYYIHGMLKDDKKGLLETIFREVRE